MRGTRRRASTRVRRKRRVGVLPDSRARAKRRIEASYRPYLGLDTPVPLRTPRSDPTSQLSHPCSQNCTSTSLPLELGRHGVGPVHTTPSFSRNYLPRSSRRPHPLTHRQAQRQRARAQAAENDNKHSRYSGSSSVRGPRTGRRRSSRGGYGSPERLKWEIDNYETGA